MPARRRAFRGIVSAAAIAVGSACSGWIVSESDAAERVVLPEPAYETLFSHYVELCAVSQYRSLSGSEGGVPGHAAMYLKGACKDEGAAIPQLRACRDTATRRDAPEHGAGVSVNSRFRNVNWIAVPGTRLFFEGEVAPDEGVDRAAFERTARRAIDAGVFRGVRFHDDTPDLASLQSVVERDSLATDFALRFARSVYCARLPVTDEMMGEIIAYLNALNREYASGRADYDWSGLSDNCAHLVHNALAAASIWEPRSVGATRLRQLLHLAVPANEVVELARLGAEGPLADGREVYRNDEARDALLDFDWLPRRHGALVTQLPVHQPNALFDTRSRILVLQWPIVRGVAKAATRLGRDPRFTRLRPNLEHFEQVYREILADRDELIAGGLLPLRSVRYLRPTKRYYGYVEAQLAEVEAMRAWLARRPG